MKNLKLLAIALTIIFASCSSDDNSPVEPVEQQPTNPVTNIKNLKVYADQSSLAPNHIKIYKKLANGTYEQLNTATSGETKPNALVYVGDIVKISYAIGNDNQAVCIKYTYDNRNFSARYCLMDNKAYSTFVEFTVE